MTRICVAVTLTNVEALVLARLSKRSSVMFTLNKALGSVTNEYIIKIESTVEDTAKLMEV